MAKTIIVEAKGWRLKIVPGVGIFKINKAKFYGGTGNLVIWVTNEDGSETSHRFSPELPAEGGTATLKVDRVVQWKFVLDDHATLSYVG